MLPPKTPLHLITDLPAQTAAHAQLTTELRAAATWTGPRALSSRGGARTQQVSWIDAPHNFWCASSDAHDNRFALGFGTQDPRSRQSLPITAWINPAKGTATHSSGAFIRDADGALYLCHTGKVGGGKKGVGKHAFLGWLDRTQSRPRVQVDGRELVPVARLGSDSLVADIASYITAIQAFKAEVGESSPSDEDDDDGDDEPWSLDTVLQALDPAHRTPVLASYSDGIHLAHAVSPACWCITRRQGPRLRLLVGRTVALELARGLLGVGLHLPSLSTLPDPDIARSDTAATDFEYAGLDDSVFRKYSLARFLEIQDQLRPAFERFVQLAGAAFRNTPYARYHAPDLLHQLQTAMDTKLPRPAHAGDAPSYWKVSPGENGRLWDECREGGYIAVGWNELGDLSGLDRDGFNARLDAALLEFPTWKRRGVTQAWRFANIPEGARIVANDGTQRVLGIGTVTGPYRFVDDGREFAHRLPVEWDDTRERAFDMTGLTSTVIQLSSDKFAQILAAPSPGEEPPEDPASEAQSDEQRGFEGILDRLGEMGLQFPDDLVASYLLALQAKRFVVLSGISGTGKTQLALAIARTFQPSGATDEDDAPEPDPDVRRIRVQPYMKKYRRFVVPVAMLGLLTDGEPKRIDVHFGEGETESLRLADSGTAMELLFKGGFRQWFDEHFSVGDEFEVRVGTEDPAELHISRVDQADAPPPIPSSTYRVVAVRPDWTDNRGLLGYYNPITREYQPTPFLRLLLAAEEEYRAAQRARRPSHPFFAILDEMNLARVEHYFSDFLSCLESGEPIHLHDDPLVAAGASEDGDPVPMHVTIPPNLFLTGTVNVDETTYMFSPKVLDRAFVLEFNDVDLDTLGAGAADESDEDSSPLALQHFTGSLDVRTKAIDYAAFRGLLGGALHRALLQLNERLHAEHRHFGYRVANEIARFISLARTQAGEGPDVLWDAFDVAVIAKVLPKLHGTQQELEQILGELHTFASGETDACPHLPRSASKLARMKRRLGQVGFVSFIE